MTWGRRRQVIYASIVIGFLLVVFGVVVLVIVLSQEPSCNDGIQNQDERGVDCGGVCQLVCTQDAFNLSTLWAQSVFVDDDIYHGVAYVENQNVGSGAVSIDYKFTLYDASNVLIGEREGSTYLSPNTRTAIFEPKIITGNRVPELVLFELTSPIQWVRTPLEFSKQLLTVEQQQAFNIRREPKIIAKVRNDSIYQINDVDLIVLVYDAADNLIASSMTYTKTFEPGSAREVFFTWPHPFERPPARVEIVPRFNPFTQ